MMDWEDSALSAEEIVARAIRADVLTDRAVRQAILQEFPWDIRGKDSPSSLLHRPSKDWVKYRRVG
jgi:hypothetical protein